MCHDRQPATRVRRAAVAALAVAAVRASGNRGPRFAGRAGSGFGHLRVRRVLGRRSHRSGPFNNAVGRLVPGTRGHCRQPPRTKRLAGRRLRCRRLRLAGRRGRRVPVRPGPAAAGGAAGLGPVRRPVAERPRPVRPRCALRPFARVTIQAYRRLHACIGDGMATADDLTARARIRDAALRQFGEQGFERKTIRGIAATAGVSPGLVRHHFGSKDALRDAVDEHVLTEIRRINDEVRKGIAANGEFSEDAITRAAIRPFQGYLARAMVDGSAIISAFFDQIVGLTEEWLGDAEELTDNEFFADRRTRAAVLSAMAMGVPLLREQLSRVLGVDSFSPEGERMVSMALLDIYSHVLITPELAAAARKAFDSYGGGDHE